MSDIIKNKAMNQQLDELESVLTEYPKAELPVTHRFTPGIYIREIFIPAGTMLTSMEHKTEHPFVISQGKIIVTSENEGKVVYEAPFTGITKPGTRRALFAETDVVWTTFHATEETDVEKIGETILEPHENLLLTDPKSAQGWRESLPNKPQCLTSH